MDNFSIFLNIIEATEKHGLVYVEGNNVAHLLNDLGLPTVQKTARIEHVIDKKNPIYIGLSDGTKLFLTWDEFRRIEGTPARGKKMTVVMQRRFNDQTEIPSIITKCIVHD